MALASSIGGSREIIDIEIMAPRETVADAKAGNSDGMLSARNEDGGQPVAGGAQDGFYVLDKRSLVPVRRTKLAHRVMPEVCLARRQLPDRDRGCLRQTGPPTSDRSSLLSNATTFSGPCVKRPTSRYPRAAWNASEAWLGGRRLTSHTMRSKESAADSIAS
jgi:hypothetical protein